VNDAVPIPPDIEKILDLARWAPSGDNTQPWRFEVVDDHRFVIQGNDTRDWCVYDLDGRASQIALGALVENISLAAGELGLAAAISLREDSSETKPTFDVELNKDPKTTRDPLVDAITKRVTQRRPLKTAPLAQETKTTLEQSVGDGYSITWVDDRSARWKMAKLLFGSAKIRLTIPEAYEVHRRIIEWDATESTDRIPDKAVGMDPLGLALMRWAMTSWQRVDFLNRYLAGTWLPRLQLDLAPGFLCAAHFLIKANSPPQQLADFLAGGRAMQRFWLAATREGLQFQPEMTPLIFARYADQGIVFTEKAQAREAAATIGRRLRGLIGDDCVDYGVFMGRVGQDPAPTARSTRLEVRKLMANPGAS
jgi:nitroreductase